LLDPLVYRKQSPTHWPVFTVSLIVVSNSNEPSTPSSALMFPAAMAAATTSRLKLST